MKELYGAPVERGEITAREADGYRVRSMTRDGVNTPPIDAVRWTIETEDGDIELRAKYEPGDRVYFIINDDGTGVILGRA